MAKRKKERTDVGKTASLERHYKKYVAAGRVARGVRAAKPAAGRGRIVRAGPAAKAVYLGPTGEIEISQG